MTAKGRLARQHPERVPVLQWWRHDMLWAPPDRCQGQGHQEVSSHKILRDEHRRAKDTHKPCSSILARFGKGAMCQQGTKN